MSTLPWYIAVVYSTLKSNGINLVRFIRCAENVREMSQLTRLIITGEAPNCPIRRNLRLSPFTSGVLVTLESMLDLLRVGSVRMRDESASERWAA